MARTITIDGTDRTAITRLDSIRLQTSAFRGEVGAGSIVIDDTGSSITIDPLKAVTIVEDSSTPSRIFTGYTAERGIQRGPLRAGTQRQWLITLEDLNVLLDDVLLGGDGGAKRPEETDVARITWLLTTDAMTHYSITAGQVPNTATKTMGPEDYRGRFARDVLEDCSQRTGKNFYLYDEGSGFKLYYDKQANASASPISISDVLADVNGSTVFAPSALDILKDPERKYDRIRLIYKGGAIERGGAAIAAPNRRREKRVVNKRIKSRARAREHVENLLDQTDAETVVIGVTVGVPASVVGDIRAGQLIPLKLTHAGIAAYTNYRIASVTIGPRPGDRGDSDVEYEVVLKMADKIRPTHVQDVGGPGGGGGGVPDDEKTPGDGGQEGGGPVDGNDYVLDDYDRTPPFIGSPVKTTTSGTSHRVFLPPGSDVGGRTLVVFAINTDPSSVDTAAFDFANAAVALGWDVPAARQNNERAGDYVISDTAVNLSGSEGIPSTGAFLDTTSVASIDIEWITFLIEAEDPDQTPVAFLDGITADPQAVDPTAVPGWTASFITLYLAMVADKTSVSGDPTGYTNLDSGSGVHPWRMSYKVAPAASEDPSAYTSAGGAPLSYTLAYKPTTTQGFVFGRIPVQQDTGAWWDGGNYYQVLTDSNLDDSGIDGALFFVESSTISGQLKLFLETDDTDNDYEAELPTELATTWTMTGRFRLTTAGSLTDAGLRRYLVTVVAKGRYATFGVLLGDATNGQGVIVSNDTGGSTAAAKDIGEGDWWRFRAFYDDEADTISARIWDEADDEPTTYDVTVATSTTSDDDGITITTHLGNDGGTAQRFEVDWLNFRRLSAPGGSTITHTLTQTGDGTTTQYTVQPYRAGTLHVWVDGIAVPVLSAQDPAAGTFTFDRAPAKGSIITVTYEAI